MPNSESKLTVLHDFLDLMFYGQEEMAQAHLSSDAKHDAKPLTDEQLELFVRGQFAHYEKVIASLDHLSSFSKSRIRVWRSEYNRGLWKSAPRARSFRYGPEGWPINSQQRKLSEISYAEDIVTFKFDDFRKKDALAFLNSFKENRDVNPQSQTKSEVDDRLANAGGRPLETCRRSD